MSTTAKIAKYRAMLEQGIIDQQEYDKLTESFAAPAAPTR
jgi:hypothetical protein